VLLDIMRTEHADIAVYNVPCQRAAGSR